jgi:hypothetical protein
MWKIQERRGYPDELDCLEGAVTAAAGEVVTAAALAHGAAHRCARLAAMHAAQARTPLQLVPDVGGPEAADSLVVFANLGQTCEKKNLPKQK